MEGLGHLEGDKEALDALWIIGRLAQDQLLTFAPGRHMQSRGLAEELGRALEAKDVRAYAAASRALGGLDAICRRLEEPRRRVLWKKIFFGAGRRRWAQALALAGAMDTDAQAGFCASVFLSHAQWGHPLLCEGLGAQASGRLGFNFGMGPQERCQAYWGPGWNDAQKAQARSQAFDQAAAALAGELDRQGRGDLWLAALEGMESAGAAGSKFGGFEPVAGMAKDPKWGCLVERWQISGFGAAGPKRSRDSRSAL